MYAFIPRSRPARVEPAWNAAASARRNGEKGDSREQIKTARKETKETRLKAIDFYNNLLQA